MSKVILGIIAVLLFAQVAFADTSTQTINVSCVVDTHFQLSAKAYYTGANGGAPWTEIVPAAINFGSLLRRTDANGNDLALINDSNHQITVQMGINTTLGRQYQVTQSASQLLTSAANTIPQNAFVATTVTGGSTLNGGTLNQAGTAVGVSVAPRVLFTSAANGAAAVVNISYGISDQGGAGNVVSPNQPAGTYTTVITYTAATL